MSDASETPQAALPDGTGSPSVVGEVRRAVQRRAESLLDSTKVAIRTAIEEAITNHGVGLVTGLRETLKTALDGMVKVQIEKMVEKLNPVSNTTREMAEGWLRELREFIGTTVRDLIEKRIPEYSRRAGQRVIDYTLAGVLFAVGAVLLFVGAILGLRELGVPAYISCLGVGALALVFGFALLKLRSRRWDAPLAADSASATKPPGG